MILRHTPSALGTVGFLGALAFLAAGAFLGVLGLTALGFVTCTAAAASVPGRTADALCADLRYTLLHFDMQHSPLRRSVAQA